VCEMKKCYGQILTGASNISSIFFLNFVLNGIYPIKCTQRDGCH
jgi:hypothetical protein